MLLESEEDILLSDNEEIELINDVDILEGVSTEDPGQNVPERDW